MARLSWLKKSFEKAAKKILIYSIKGYQNCISPYLKTSCRFYPTCSQYAILAIRQYPIFTAIKKIIIRICSCHPFSKKNPIDMP